ncbi:hypothetical protein AGMMS49983_10120 [Clostridia bacterium]|nr:hypothetical protein AGMMS49983_10120 [Clostridia bacterium]
MEWADIVFVMEPIHLNQRATIPIYKDEHCRVFGWDPAKAKAEYNGDDDIMERFRKQYLSCSRDADCGRVCHLFYGKKPVVCLGIHDHYKYGSEVLKAELKRKMRLHPYWADSFAAESDRPSEGELRYRPYPYWLDSFVAESDRPSEGEPLYRHFRFEDIKDWKHMRSIAHWEFLHALFGDPLLPITLDQEADVGWLFDPVRAKVFYNTLWTFWYSSGHWADYYWGDDRRELGEPYTPTEAEMKCMLVTAILYTDTMPLETAREGAYKSVLSDADVLIRYGRPDSRDVIALYLKLAVYCFSTGYRISDEDGNDIPYCDYMLPKNFERILDAVREEYLQDFRFALVAERFIRRFVGYFSKEIDGRPMWERCRERHNAYKYHPEAWAKNWLPVLERAETLLHEIGSKG